MNGSTKTSRKAAAVEKVEEIKTYKLQPFRAQTARQKDLNHHCLKDPLVVAIGPAGTGKSYVGAHAACRLLVEKKIKRIILTRNPLPTGTSLGFFAGSEKEKMAVWLGPVIGTLKKILKTQADTDGFFNYLVEQGQISFQPLETIKGSSFDDTFIFVEEAQELCEEQLKTLTTRIGKNSTLFLNGDLAQTNSRNKYQDFRVFVDMLYRDTRRPDVHRIEEWDTVIPVVTFGVEDIVRSGITRKMVDLWTSADQ